VRAQRLERETTTPAATIKTTIDRWFPELHPQVRIDWLESVEQQLPIVLELSAPSPSPGRSS